MPESKDPENASVAHIASRHFLKNLSEEVAILKDCRQSRKSQ